MHRDFYKLSYLGTEQLKMKFITIFGAITALAGPAAAFYGQMAASAMTVSGEGPAYQLITLTDYNTGSIYSGDLNYGFSSTQESV